MSTVQERRDLMEEQSVRQGGPSTMAQMKEAELLVAQFEGFFGNKTSATTPASLLSPGIYRPLREGADSAGPDLPPLKSLLSSPIAPKASPTSPIKPQSPYKPLSPYKVPPFPDVGELRKGAAAEAPTVSGPLNPHIRDVLEGVGSQALSQAAASEATTYCGKAPSTLLFTGGCSQWAAYIGAVRRMEEAHLLESVSTFVGSSGGAQAAALLAFGYGSKELEDAAVAAPSRALLDLESESDKAGFPCGACRNIYRLLTDYGVCTGDALEGFVDKLFAEKFGKTRCTFRELFEWSGKELHIGATDLATRSFKLLDRRSHPDLPVCVAVRASRALPLLFRPVSVDAALYVDAGIGRSVPLSTFCGAEQALAFSLMEAPSGPAKKPANFLQFLWLSLTLLKDSEPGLHGHEAFSQQQQSSLLRSENLDLLSIAVGQESEVSRLVQRGYEEASRYLRPTTE